MTIVDEIPATGPIIVDGPIEDPLGLLMAPEEAEAEAAQAPEPAPERAPLALRFDERLTVKAVLDYVIEDRNASGLIAFLETYGGLEPGALDDYGADEFKLLETMIWLGLIQMAGEQQGLPFPLKPCKLRDIAELEQCRDYPFRLIDWLCTHSGLTRAEIEPLPGYLALAAIPLVGKTLGLPWLK